MRSGEKEKKIDTMTRAVRVIPSSYLVNNAYLYSLTARWGGSLDEIQDYLNMMKDHLKNSIYVKHFMDYDTYFLARQMGRKSGNSKKILELYTELIEKHPTAFDFYFQRALILQNIKKYDLALQDLYKSIELNPYSYNSYENIGYILNKQGNLGESVKYLMSSLEIDKYDPDSLTYLANIFSNKIRRLR